MAYRLCQISHVTIAMPKVTPAWAAHSTQRGTRAPVRRSAPSIARAAKPATPMIGFGMPRASAWGVFITDPQERTGLMLHVGT